MKNYLKYRLFSALINPFFYAASILFNLLCAVYFFVIKGFFTGAAGTDFFNLFFIAPFLSVILIPVLVHSSKKTSLEDSIPLSALKKIIAEWLSVSIEFSLIVLPLILVPCCVNLFGKADWGIFFSGFMLFIFYGFSAAAACIFFEVIFRNSSISLIIGMLFLGIMSAANLLLPQTADSLVLSAILKTLSLNWHFSSAETGIFDSRDFLFFITFAAAALVLAFITAEIHAGKLFSKRERLQFFCFAAVLVFLNLNSSILYIRKDISGTGRLATSKYTDSIISGAEDVVFITYYRSSVLQNLYPEERCVSAFYSELARRKNVIFKEVNADSESVQQTLQDYGIYGREFRTSRKNSTEFTTVYSSVVFEYGGKWDALPFVLSSSSLEFETDLKLLSLVYGRKNTVSILCGNGLSLSADYSYLVPWLTREGFACNEIKINDSKELPVSDPLIILGSSRLSGDEVSGISTFIEKGGLVFACASPYEADIENSWYITKAENQDFISLLADYGMSFTGAINADISCSRIIMQSDTDEKGRNNPVSKSFNYPLWPYALPQQNAPQGLTLFWPGEVYPSADDVSVLCVSSPSAWSIEPDFKSPETLFVTNPFDVSENSYAQEKNTKPLVLSSKQIVLVPDPYFVHSLMLGYISESQRSFSNLDFITSELYKLEGMPELSALLEKSYSLSNQGFFKTYDDETYSSARGRTLFSMFVLIPVMISSAGIIFFRWRRTRKYEF